MTEAISDIWKVIGEDVLHYLKEKNVKCILAHGSFAEGIANKNSDFDLLAICDERVKEGEDVFSIGRIEVNITFMHEETLLKQMDSLEDLLKPNNLGQAIPMVCRLRNAVIVFDYENTGKRIVEFVRKFHSSENLIDIYSKCGLNYYYDAVGAFVSGNYDASVHMARIGALQVMTGILLECGELYVKQKWYTELARKMPCTLREMFLKLMGLDTVDKEQAQQSIQGLNDLIQEFQRLRE
ncbi:MAG: nucleotidyltransferase domain-containing protein [Theionarchaea archaeon]|nr:nucleotidyltransferase domain-containing protein [Theionarchaea archaeon]